MTRFLSIAPKYGTTPVKHQVYLVVLFSSVFQGAVSLYSLYLSRKGISDHDISIHYSILGLGSLIGGMTGGVLGEYFSVRRMLYVLTSALIIIMLGLTYNTWLIFSFFIGFGITANKSNLLNYFSAIKSKEIAEIALSWRRFALNLGVAFGAWLIGFILKLNAKYFTVFCCLILFINLLFVSFLPPNSNGIKKQAKLIQKIGKSHFWVLCLIFILALFPFSLISNLYLLHIKNKIGLTEAVAGNVFLFNGLMIILFQVPAIRLLQKVKTRWKCFFGILLIGFGIGAIGMSQNEFQVYCGVLAWSIGELILFVPFLQSFLKNAPFTRGKSIGIYQLCFSFSEFIYPLIASQIILISSYYYLWVFVILTSIATSILSLKFIK